MINLSTNENAWGCSPRVSIALQSALNDVHAYPDANYIELKTALSQQLNVSTKQIMLGNGSEHLLELIVRGLILPHQNAIFSEYAFLTIPLILKNHHITTKVIPTKNWCEDIEQMVAAIDANTRLLFLVNPSNPTGTYTTNTQFDYLMQHVPANVIVVVDEAYFEYIQQEDYPFSLSYLNLYPNLIITRTFSKGYGLAGLRIGYAISSEYIINKLEHLRLPYHVNALAAKAASVALTDIEYIRKVREYTHLGINQLRAGLLRLGISYLPTNGNFITAHISNASIVTNSLLSKGIKVKSLQDYGLYDYMRITVGTCEQNELILSSIGQIISIGMMVK